MVINKINTIAFKCPICGSLEFNNISIFDFSGKKEYTIACSCKSGFVKIITNKNRKYSVSMPCIACNEDHTYFLSYKALWDNEILILKCPNTYIELCFIGNDDVVRRAVDKYEMQMDILMNDIGYDDYFINNTVMLETVDKIHDIAEQGNLLCQCGSDEISLEMFYDRVELICNQCSTNTVIKACTNQDLKQTLNKDSIVLCDDFYDTVNLNRQRRIYGLAGPGKNVCRTYKRRQSIDY